MMRAKWTRFLPLLALLLGLGWLAPAAHAQQVWVDEVSRSTGQAITVAWEYADADAAQLTGWQLERSTDTGAPTVVATGGPATREFTVSMPGGSTKKYRFKPKPFITSAAGVRNVGPAGNEVIVLRK